MDGHIQNLKLIAESCGQEVEKFSGDKKIILKLNFTCQNSLIIGFNFGYNCLMALMNSQGKVTCYDSSEKKYVQHAVKYLQNKFPHRFILVNGDTIDTLSNCREMFDLVVIDGEKTFRNANLSFFLAKDHIVPDGVIIFRETEQFQTHLWDSYVRDDLVTPLTSNNLYQVGKITRKRKIAILSIPTEENRQIVKLGQFSKQMYCEKFGYDFYDKEFDRSSYDCVIVLPAESYITNFDVRLKGVLKLEHYLIWEDGDFAVFIPLKPETGLKMIMDRYCPFRLPGESEHMYNFRTKMIKRR